MDPKMDSGFVPAGDTFEPEFDVCRPLSAEEVLWIMDQLSCLEIAWHDGYPLSQTVFTSLHIDRLISPDNQSPYTFDLGGSDGPSHSNEAILVHTVLRAYCIGVIKCCHLALHVIQSQNFYEEEDFVTHLFGRELLPKLGANEAIRGLHDAIRTLTDTADLSTNLREALQTRLQFRRSLLTSFTGDEDRWASLAQIVPRIGDSHALAHPLEEAFSAKVQRQLATSTPPRPMLVVSWKDACQRWSKMFDDIVEAHRLTDFWICQSPHCLQRATWAFVYRQPQPSTLARAYMQDILFGSDRLAENVSHFDLLLTDMRDLVLAGDSLADPESFQIEVPSDPRHQCARHVEAFMDKAFDEYLNLYRMVCQNRCRMRRTFTQAIPILDTLETEAERADETLYSMSRQQKNLQSRDQRLDPLTSWVKFHKLQIMSWTVQLGFETDIYLADELDTMYWLLAHFTRSRRALLEHIEHHLLERLKDVTRARTSRYAAECLASADWLKSLLAQSDATIHLATALWRLCTLLVSVRGISSPKRDYAQDQLLYDVRMKPYLGVVSHDGGDASEVPTLDAIREARHFTGTLEAACRAIDADVKAAKAALAKLKDMSPQQAKYVGTEERWRREIKQMETTCVAVSVQASQVLRIGEKHGVMGKDVTGFVQEEGGGERFVEVSVPPPGKRYHDWWVVPQVQEVRKA